MTMFSRCVLAVTTIVFLTAGVGWSAYQPKPLEIGSAAPDFNLPGVDGKNYTLADFADSNILVTNFTCNHCPTARANEERIKKIAADYKDKGVAVVCISSNDPCAVRQDELAWSDVGDSFEDMKIRARDKKFNFPYLYDGDTQQVAKAYGPVTTPHVFIFDRQRKLRYVGRVDSTEWMVKPNTVHDARNAIEALLAGEKVPVEKARTFGCSIKWSDNRESVKKEREQLAKEKIELEMIDVNSVKKLVRNDTKKLRLINVWASWCGPCKVELPELVKIHKIYRNRKTTEFELITISGDPPKNKEVVLLFLKEFQASCKNYLYDSDDKYKLVEAVDKQWPVSIPYTLLIAPGGEVVFRHMGAVNPLEIKRAIVGYYAKTLPWWVSE